MRIAAVLGVALFLAGAGIAEARGGGNSGGGRSSGGHSSSGHSRGYYSHGYSRPYYYYGSRFIIGAPYYSYPGYYYPYPASTYYTPAPVYYEQQTPLYEPQQNQLQQQPQGQSQQDPGAYWYYCTSSSQYYPHVQTCAGGWQRVSPQPPPG